MDIVKRVPDDIKNIIKHFFIDTRTGYTFKEILIRKHAHKYSRKLLKVELFHWKSRNLSIQWLKAVGEIKCGCFDYKKEGNLHLYHYELCWGKIQI